MSTIDRRIVEMKFDNGEFSKNTESTLKDLEALEKALRFDSAGEGLSKLESQASSLSLGSISSAVDNIGSRFSVLGTIGTGALMSIGSKAVEVGAQLVSSIMDPLVNGGKKRALNLENADFTLKGLGSSLEKMQEAIDYAVKDTAYGMDSAAKASSMVYASGYKSVEQQKVILRSISGIAAMTNSSYDDISDVMTKVAGQGRLMGDDMNRLAARGLNVAATLADSFGMTEEEVRDLVSEGKVSFMDFATVMDNAYGEHAKKANDTYTGAVSNFKAAWSRIGAQFFTPYFEAIRNLANGFKPLVDIINKGLGPVLSRLGEFMISTSEGVQNYLDRFTSNQEYYDTIWNTVNNIAESFASLAGLIRDLVLPVFKGLFGYFWQGDLPFFQGIEKGTYYIREFINALRPSAKSMENFQKIGRAVGAVISLLWDVLSGVVTVFTTFVRAIFPVNTGVGDLSGSVADLVTNFVDAIKNSGALQKAFEKLYKVADLLGSGIRHVAEFARNAYEFLDALGVIDFIVAGFVAFYDITRLVFTTVIDKVKEAVEHVKDFFTNTVDLQKAWETFYEFIEPVWDKFVDGLKKIQNGAKEALDVFNDAIDAGKGFGESFIEAIKSIFSSKDIDSGASSLGQQVSGSVGSFWQGFIDGIKRIIGNSFDMGALVIGGIGDIGKDTLSTIVDSFQNISGIDASRMIGLSILSVLAGGFFNAMSGFKELSHSTSGLFKSIKDFFGSVGGYFKSLSENIKYNNLLKIAGAIALIAGSIWLLSKIDPADMWRAVAGIGAVAAVMIILSALMSKLPKMSTVKNAGSMIGMIVQIAAVLLVVAYVFKTISTAVKDLNGTQILALIGSMIAMGVLISVIGTVLSTMNKSMKGIKLSSMAASVAAIAVIMWSLSKLVDSMVPLAKAPIAGIMTATIGMALIIGIVAAIMVTMSEIKDPKAAVGMLVAGGSIFLVLTSLARLADSLAGLAGVPWAELEPGLKAIVAILAVVGGVLLAIGALTSFNPMAAAGVLAAGGAIWIAMDGVSKLASAIKTLADTNLENSNAALDILKDAIVKVGAILAVVGLIPTTVIGGAAVWLAGGGLKDMALGLVAFSTVDLDSVNESMGKMEVVLKAITDMFSETNPFSTMVASGALKTAGDALSSLPDALKKWEGVSVPADIAAQLTRLATGIQAFNVGDIWGALAADSAVLVMNDLPGALKKWSDGIHVPEDIQAQLTRLANGIHVFNFGDIWGAIAAGMATGVLDDLPPTLAKWVNVAVPGDIDVQLGLIAAGIKSFGGIAGIINSWGADKNSASLKDLADAVRYWGDTRVPADIDTQLTSLATGIGAFNDNWISDKSGDATKAAGAVSAMRDAVKGWPSNIGTLGSSLISLADGLNTLSSASTLDTFASTLSANLSSISGSLKVKGADLSNSLITGFASNQSRLVTVSRTFAGQIAIGIMDAKPTISASATILVLSTTLSITKGLSDKKTTINNAAKNAASGMGGAMIEGINRSRSSVYNTAYSLGVYLGSGIVNGIEAKRYTVMATANSIAAAAISAIRSAWDVQSPSKKAYYLSTMLMAGLVNGISNHETNLTSASASAADAAIKELQNVFSSGSERSLSDFAPVITPVLDISEVEKQASAISSLFNGVNAAVDSEANVSASLAAAQNRAALAESNSGTTYNYQYEQTINSPKAVDNAEIYRRSKSLVEKAKVKSTVK